mmetsp:Transcript_94786/g.272882  ORF Transcript_94786/g.272882 Transcript_94786/m.272882 type:complete len:261 (+) Transcript_94786:3-785(+)
MQGAALHQGEPVSQPERVTVVCRVLGVGLWQIHIDDARPRSAEHLVGLARTMEADDQVRVVEHPDRVFRRWCRRLIRKHREAPRRPWQAMQELLQGVEDFVLVDSPPCCRNGTPDPKQGASGRQLGAAGPPVAPIHPVDDQAAQLLQRPTRRQKEHIASSSDTGRVAPIDDMQLADGEAGLSDTSCTNEMRANIIRDHLEAPEQSEPIVHEALQFSAVGRYQEWQTLLACGEPHRKSGQLVHQETEEIRGEHDEQPERGG